MRTADLYTRYLEHPHVCTDTRHIRQGDLFFALRGEHFDGNRFAAAALAAGASLAVVDDPAVAVSEQYFLVEDVLSQLQDMARHHRRHFDAPVIAITGSNGKTTTKELLFAVLAGRYEAYATRGNLNNHIGVPLTLLSIPLTAEVLVIEMGANHQGEIADLCRIAEPTHGLITNVGKAHLEGFGGIEGVKKGKGELYEWILRRSGVIFVNADEPHLTRMAAGHPHPIFYGSKDVPKDGIVVEAVRTHPTVTARFAEPGCAPVEIDSYLAGQHNFANIMTAIALGQYFKVPVSTIKNAVENYLPGNQRSQLLTHQGNRFYLDTYNANPDSMRAALQSFAALPGEKKAVFLGDMLELGTDSDAAHREIAELALSLGFTTVVLVGPHFGAAARALHLPHFSDSAQLRSWFDEQDWKDYFIFLKGSRGMRMERVVE